MDEKKDTEEREVTNIVSDEDLALINQHTLKKLTSDEVFVFKVRLCDNEVDRVGDRMNETALQQIADSVCGLTGLQDHDWSSDKQCARLYAAELVSGEGTNKLGEPLKYVLGKAYTLTKYKDYIDKINAGLLKETSISFRSTGDKCGICGKPTSKLLSDVAVCEDGHEANQEYEGKLCYNSIENVTDVLEWSLVAVPCQRDAGIKEKKFGGSLMKRTEMLLRRLTASKALGEEAGAELSKALEEGAEMSDEEIKALISENEELKKSVETLTKQLGEVEESRKQEKIGEAVDKAFEDANLMFPETKELLKKELPWDDFELTEDGVNGLAEAMEQLTGKYCKLFGSKEDPEDKGEGENRAVEKSVKQKPGISLGLSAKSYGGQVKEVKKPGIYF